MVSRDVFAGQMDDATTAAITAALTRILSSDAFRGAPQLSAFLDFIVGRTLAGRSGELKAYTVAVEAFGRPSDFDPQTDPIVRVEAGRLRKALGQYYSADGRDDPIRISIPVGGYVPAFAFGAQLQPEELDETVLEAEAPTPSGGRDTAVAATPPDRVVARRWKAAAIAILVAGLAVLAYWYASGGMERLALVVAPESGVPVATEAGAPAAVQPVQGHLPVLAVTLTEVPSDATIVERARRFVDVLVDTMARFDDLVVVKAPLESWARPDGVDYLIEISPARTRTGENVARLRAVRDGRIVWTASSDQPLPLDSEIVEVARRVAIRLAEPYGVVYADNRQNPSPAMRCIVQAMDFHRTMKPDDHRNARNCLEALLERNPNFHPAWSQLALLILDETISGINPQPGIPLDRALAAALTAVRLAPSSARAQQALMDVFFARGQIDDALAAGREALTHNPYDPDVMADLGGRYVRLGRTEEGLPLLLRAIALSSARPPWYDFFAFLGARLNKDDEAAASHAARLLADGGALSQLGRAMHLARTGDDVGFAAAIKRLSELAPLFSVDPRLFLASRGFSPRVIELVMVDLGPGLAQQLRPR